MSELLFLLSKKSSILSCFFLGPLYAKTNTRQVCRAGAAGSMETDRCFYSPAWVLDDITCIRSPQLANTLSTVSRAVARFQAFRSELRKPTATSRWRVCVLSTQRHHKSRSLTKYSRFVVQCQWWLPRRSRAWVSKCPAYKHKLQQCTLVDIPLSK